MDTPYMHKYKGKMKKKNKIFTTYNTYKYNK